jgi:hypothetical protein
MPSANLKLHIQFNFGENIQNRLRLGKANLSLISGFRLHDSYFELVRDNMLSSLYCNVLVYI